MDTKTGTMDTYMDTIAADIFHQLIPWDLHHALRFSGPGIVRSRKYHCNLAPAHPLSIRPQPIALVDLIGNIPLESSGL